MTHARRFANIGEEYFTLDKEIKMANNELKKQLAPKTARLKELRKLVDGETGRVTSILGKIRFLYTHTVGASVAKEVSDAWTDEQWALFESLGGVRTEKISLASVTKEG